MIVVTRHSTSRHQSDEVRSWTGLYSITRTLRGFKACTTFGRKYCCASRNVTEAMVSNPTLFWILPRLRSVRHDAYARVTSRKCRAYGDTRRERHTIVAIFTRAVGACLVHKRHSLYLPREKSISPTYHSQCCH